MREGSLALPSTKDQDRVIKGSPRENATIGLFEAISNYDVKQECSAIWTWNISSISMRIREGAT